MCMHVPKAQYQTFGRAASFSFFLLDECHVATGASSLFLLARPPLPFANHTHAHASIRSPFLHERKKKKKRSRVA